MTIKKSFCFSFQSCNSSRMHTDPLNILPSGSPSIEILNIEFRINGKISLKNTFYQTCSEYGPDGKNNYAFLHPKWEKGVTKGSEVGVSCRRNRYVLWPVLVGGGVYYVCWPSWYSAQNYPHLSGWVGRKNISSPWPWWWSVEKFWLQSDWFLWIIQICKWRKPIYLNVHNLGLYKSLEAEGKWTFQEKDKSLVLIEVL